MLIMGLTSVALFWYATLKLSQYDPSTCFIARAGRYLRSRLHAIKIPLLEAKETRREDRAV